LDSFEFVQIPVAIVLGFGISEILAGWGHQLRHRHEQPFSGLQVVASAYVLMWAFRYLWIQWSSRPEVWDYAAYLLSVTPAVVIALAAHSIRFDPSIEERDNESRYERSRQPVCWLLAALPTLMAVRLLYIFGFQKSDAPIPTDGLLLLPGGLLLTTLVFVRLATTTRPRDQWIGWLVNWAVLLTLLALMVPQLAPTNQ
jgi:hypothetical protein